MSERETYPHNTDRPRGERVALLGLGLLGLLTVVYLVQREASSGAEFRRYQRRYRQLVGDRAPQPGRIRRISTREGTDRCPTCHLAIPGGSAATKRPGARRPELQHNPYRPHPGRLLAQHPPDRFLCTSCHGAGGAYVDRCRPAQGDADARALGRELAQSSCLACHRRERGWHLPGAPLLTAGLQAYRRLGCGGCHAGGPLVRKLPRIGPPLEQVWSKLTPRFMRGFLADPQQQRPGSAMPSFFSIGALEGAPRYTVERVRGEAQERIDALLALLRRGQRPWAPAPSGGDAARGARRFVQRGCVACHLGGPPHDRPRGGLGGVGPDLSRAGARLSGAWIADWLRRPTRYSPETRMPDPRLDEADVLDLARYLVSLGGPASGPARPAPTKAKVAAGARLARELGCPGCHRLRGMEREPAVGPDLDGFGDKREALLDWGTRRPTPERQTWRRWTELKLSRPLTFDRREGSLQMPWQRLQPGELRGLVVLMRGLVAGRPPGPTPRPRATPRPEQRVRRGETLVQELGCRRCHRVGRRGGAIRVIWPRPSDRAPSLEGEGAKVQPQWLYGFLRGPTPLRPWLELRMPTFTRLGDDGARTLAAYFAAQDRASYPFVAQKSKPPQGERLSRALELFERLQCVHCHLLSNAPRLKPGELAPDLALSGDRLRAKWIERFIFEPQKVMPGTRMPTLFPLADEDDPRSRITPEPRLFGGDVARQVRALTDLNMAWDSLGRAR